MRDEPVYRGILAIDIERFSRAEWTDPVRKRLRGRLHRLVDDALTRAEIDPSLTARSDTGDGLWLLVGPEVSTARLLHPLATGLTSDAATSNQHAPGTEQMRRRMVVHAGELLQDPYGHTGASFNQAARLRFGEARALCELGRALDLQSRHGEAATSLRRSGDRFRELGDRTGQASVRPRELEACALPRKDAHLIADQHRAAGDGVAAAGASRLGAARDRRIAANHLGSPLESLASREHAPQAATDRAAPLERGKERRELLKAIRAGTDPGGDR